MLAKCSRLLTDNDILRKVCLATCVGLVAIESQSALSSTRGELG